MLRTSNVKLVRVNSIGYSSILEIGDAKRSQQTSKAIAVQRENGMQTDEEISFSDFPIFERTSPTLTPVTTVIRKTTNHQKMITVNSIDVTGVSASSVMQVGNLESIQSEARIKHIRILKGTNE
ncbi:spore germination protein GerPE [Paraliobacillus sediminis]|uniref:spore germination protein GerPE n=1 Tax=Paraliobacillus sediminis TaxID=1885916 RepID=UPI0013C2A83C|nr:spore germination protein GerPE [Paraliobacillus sediminis]